MKQQHEKSGQGVTRRQVGVGGGAISLGLISLKSSAAEAEFAWDQDADILVVGGGCAGCAAAVTAHQNGDRVLLVEKAPMLGGTAAKSAGVLWIPNNFTLKERGIEDRKEDCMRYMARFSYPQRFDGADPKLGLSEAEYALLEAFYDNGSPAIDSLRTRGDLRLAEWRMFALDRPATDYLDHVPENKVPAGRALGPITEDGTMGLGVELMTQFRVALERRGVPVLTDHRAARLVRDSTGRVVGLECDNSGKRVAIRARKGVIFGSGGYAHNTALIDRYQPAMGLAGSCAMPWATGDFIEIAGAAGARMGDLSTAWRTQVVLEETLQGRNLAAGVFFPPGDAMVQVNRDGVRVVNEKRNYNDRTEVHGYYDPSTADFPNRLLFMVFDQRSAEAFAGAYPFPTDLAGARWILSGNSLEELAGRIAGRLGEIRDRTGGFSLSPAFAQNLAATIERFNGYAVTGVDKEFARGKAAYDNEWQLVFSPMAAGTTQPPNAYPSVTMHPFSQQGPYHAIILAAGALDTSGGPAIDADARVLDTYGSPIPGLYGAGNCIASPSGEAYYGAGHTLGMATVFGYIAANAAHREAQGEA